MSNCVTHDMVLNSFTSCSNHVRIDTVVILIVDKKSSVPGG